MIRSIIIARSSTDRHDVSCKSQIAEIEAAAKRNGEVVVKTLEFSRTKHSDFLEDPDFKDVLEEAKRKDRGWDKIWFYDTSRLSRNRMKAQTTKAFFKKHGIALDFLKLPKTGQEPLDNLIEGVLETFDQLHSDFSRAGSIRGQKQNIRSGYRAGGFAPYGYRLRKHSLGYNLDKQEITKSTLEPHGEHFPIVQEYLSRRANGESRGSVLRDFRRRGIKSPSGKDYWSSSTCSGIENNLEVYCGHLVYNKHNRRMDGRYINGERYRPEKEWEVYENAHEAAITEEQARAIRSQLKRKEISAPVARTYLLTGILQCAVCKGPMVGDSGFYTCIHKRKKVAECSNSNITAGYMDKQTIGFVKDTLLTHTHFERVIEETRRAYREEMRKTERDGARLRKEMEEIERKISLQMELFERGNISPEIIERRIMALEEEKRALADSLEGDRQVIAALEYAEAELDSKIIRGYVNRFEGLLGEGNLDQMREFIKAFIVKIELGGRENGKRKGREVRIYGQIPALTGMKVVLPRGFEPLLPP